MRLRLSEQRWQKCIEQYKYGWKCWFWNSSQRWGKWSWHETVRQKVQVKQNADNEVNFFFDQSSMIDLTTSIFLLLNSLIKLYLNFWQKNIYSLCKTWKKYYLSLLVQVNFFFTKKNECCQHISKCKTIIRDEKFKLLQC